MFRNQELRQFAACFFCIAAVFAVLGFLVSREAGILSVLSAIAYGVLFFVFTRARYRNLACLSEQIDLVLHNQDSLHMDDQKEGELSILQSEIIKMTLRIREQNDALKKEKEQLAAALADIAHQLRTPLTSANLLLSLLEKCKDMGERRTLLHETAELFVQMEWLVNSLLKLSRLDAGIVEFQIAPVDASRLIQTAVRPFLISMELHGITLQTQVPDGMMILGDFSWLTQAVQNLIKNCMQSVCKNTDGGSIEIVCTQTLLYDEIVIHDNGAGFANGDLPHLFDRFYRGKNDDASGYGIGLAICKMIITRHGGTIQARNHPQGGAVFTIRFHETKK